MPKTLSTYENQRLARIQENKAVLTKLGVQKLPQLEKKKKKTTPKKEASDLLPSRTSRRLKGEVPELNPIQTEAKVSSNDFTPEQLQARDEALLETVLEKWKSKAPVPAGADGPGLFLIPTGLEGVNDHTLTNKVPKLGTYLWGFALGLYSRIFMRLKPGDLLLFVPSGKGAFNLLGVVTETRVVAQAESDEFWSRMKYQMGGGLTANVGFPLLVLMNSRPISIDWPKHEVMRLCGYNDRLQSSRRIVVEGNDGAQVVIQRCREVLAANP